MNPQLSPLARAQIIEAATREAHSMLLQILLPVVAVATAFLVLLAMRHLVDAIERLPVSFHLARVRRALQADNRPKCFKYFQRRHAA